MHDWKSRLIAFGSDGASVNLGRKGGVAALLKQTIPHLLGIHCMAHRLERGVLHGIHLSYAALAVLWVNTLKRRC